LAVKAAIYIDCTLRAGVQDGDEEFDNEYSYHQNSEIVITYHD